MGRAQSFNRTGEKHAFCILEARAPQLGGKCFRWDGPAADLIRAEPRQRALLGWKLQDGRDFAILSLSGETHASGLILLSVCGKELDIRLSHPQLHSFPWCQSISEVIGVGRSRVRDWQWFAHFDALEFEHGTARSRRKKAAVFYGRTQKIYLTIDLEHKLQSGEHYEVYDEKEHFLGRGDLESAEIFQPASGADKNRKLF